jgi:hypothetical protein
MIEADHVIRIPQAQDAETSMHYAYTEDQLVEQPAIELFRDLGWEDRFGIGGIYRAERLLLVSQMTITGEF